MRYVRTIQGQIYAIDPDAISFRPAASGSGRVRLPGWLRRRSEPEATPVDSHRRRPAPRMRAREAWLAFTPAHVR